MVASSGASGKTAEEILEDLRKQFKQVDDIAKVFIGNLALKAEHSVDDSSKKIKESDVESLKNLLKKLDDIIYSPEVAEVANDDTQRDELQQIIDGVRKRIKESIQEELVDKFSDIVVEEDVSAPSTGGGSTARSGSDTADRDVEGFFGDFVKRNIDESRLNYETEQLRVMKLAQAYAKETNNPKFKGLDQVFEDMNNVCADKANIELIFSKMGECTPDKIQEAIDDIKSGHFTEDDIKAAYKAVLTYTKLFMDADSSFKGNSQLVDERTQVIQSIVNGNKEVDKDVPDKLIKMVRVLALHTAYARTLSNDVDDKKFKDFILDTIEYEETMTPSMFLDMLSGFAENMRQCPDQAQRLEAQKNRALIERAKNIPFMMGTIGTIIPSFEETIAQSESQAELPGSADALYAYLSNCGARYKSGEFAKDISEIESYVAYSQRVGLSMDDLITDQQETVQAEKNLIARGERYLKNKEKISRSGVKHSTAELDVKNLGRSLGFELEGNLDFSSDAVIPDLTTYTDPDLKTAKKNAMEQMILDKLSEEDYMTLRARAIQELNAKDSMALVPKGGLIVRAWDFIKSKFFRILNKRNIKTQSEETINGYIKKNYLGEMLKENAEIQGSYDKIEKEAESIKEEEIRLRDNNRKRTKERQPKDPSKDPSKGTPAGPSL